MTEATTLEETAVTLVPTLNLDAIASVSALLADARLLVEPSDDLSSSTSISDATKSSIEIYGSFGTPTSATPVRHRAWRSQSRSAHAQESAQEDPLERANLERVELLARQYVAKDFSNEETARLAIVTERVRRLIPAVTLAEYEALERQLETVQRISSDNDRIRAKLGKAPRGNG